MTTAFVTTSYPEHDDDCAGHFVRAEALRARDEARPYGGSVVVIAPAAGTPPRVTREGGISVHRLAAGDAFGWPGAATRIQARPWRAIAGVAFALRARRALRDLSPARVVAHWALPSGLVALRGAHSLELVSHGADVRLIAALPLPARAHVVRLLARRAQVWRFVSPSLRDDLLSSLPKYERSLVDDIATVRASPIDVPTDLAPRRAALPRPIHRDSIEPHRPRLVSVGRLVPSKRVDAVLRYVAEHRPGAELVVVGDGPERSRLERLANELSVHARFVGQRPRSQTLSCMADSDELVFASHVEGLSTVVREAEALGLPVTRIP